MKNLKIIILIIAVVIFSVGNVFSQTVYTVTKSTDPDPFLHEYNYVDSLCDPDMLGTLQWAIRKTNDTPGDCVIEFDIPGEGPHEIALQNYLPQIYNTVHIDGTTQTGYALNNPVIIIDGQEQISDGFCINAADSVVIQGLHIKNFTNIGMVLFDSDYSTIRNNIVNMNNYKDPGTYHILIASSHNLGIYGNTIGDETTGEVCNSTGITLWDVDNCNIGGALPGEPNVVTKCVQGVAVGNSYHVKLSRNLIYDNTSGLSLSENANYNKPSPEIHNYSNNILSGTSAPNDTVEIFGSTGGQNANEYLISTTTGPDSTWSVEVTTTYPYFIATATDVDNNTSEMSGVVESGQITTSLLDRYNNADSIEFDQFLY
ncbi:MAG: NosD domain-containing protein, partial [Bacteroidota bacterium]